MDGNTNTRINVTLMNDGGNNIRKIHRDEILGANIEIEVS